MGIRTLFPAFALGALAALSSESIQAEESKVVYAVDFESTEIGDKPNGFFLLQGAYATQRFGENQVFELPGSPLGTMGAVYGPNLGKNTLLQARAHATKQGRRVPTFGIGVNGLGGYRLLVAGSKRRLELRLNTEVVAEIPYRWKGSDEWTHFKLEIRTNEEGHGIARGKVWIEGEEEPDWMIVYESDEAPLSGKSSIWGEPFSETPIRFDDLIASSLSPEKN